MKKIIVLMVLCAIVTIGALKADTQTVRITVVPRPVDANYIVAVGHSVTIYSDANCSLVYNAKSKAKKGVTRVDLKVGDIYKRVDVYVK
jgi:hypothetical protein